MPQKNRNYSDPLDELLDKLTSGYYVDQSVNEFSSTVNDTVRNYQRTRPNPSAARRTAYKEVKPKVIPSVDTATYESRYAQVTTCLNNIDFTGYSDEKIDGYKQAISRYLELIENNKMDLRPVEDQVNSDYLALRKQIKLSNAEPYLFGYYDASMMVKKVIFNSKLARLRELSNSLK